MFSNKSDPKHHETLKASHPGTERIEPISEQGDGPESRPQATAQRRRQQQADHSPQVRELAQLQERLGQSLQSSPSNSPGPGRALPDTLRSGIESTSGLAMDDVRVHYNSPEPAQLQAAAYAKGSEIHIGPGQEKHLPHEAWHVVQQKQGRVKPTTSVNGTRVNDNPALEREADRLGAEASRAQSSIAEDTGIGATGEVTAPTSQPTSQRTTAQLIFEENDPWTIDHPNDQQVIEGRNILLARMAQDGWQGGGGTTMRQLVAEIPQIGYGVNVQTHMTIVLEQMNPIVRTSIMAGHTLAQALEAMRAVRYHVTAEVGDQNDPDNPRWYSDVAQWNGPNAANAVGDQPALQEAAGIMNNL